jgi:diketogulonate reductase-like aldo/keto reductase
MNTLKTTDKKKPLLTRRAFLGGLALMPAYCLADPLLGFAEAIKSIQTYGFIKKSIPSTNEQIPAVGMGTWVTFNVGRDSELRNQRVRVLREFFKYGGGMIDCSPMYGSSAEVLGYALAQIDNTKALFSASKVWTSWKSSGPAEMEQQRKSWNIPRFDLMQIHNLVNWEGHLETLRSQKKLGKIRYIGITTSHGRRHLELESIMRNHDLDFVQLTYNILDREAENRLLPLARERGIAVIANRPYQGGALFRKFQQKPLPTWANKEAGARNWAEFFLKFIISHPAITCAIPATSKVGHMKENMGAVYGNLPDAKVRAKMSAYVQSL